RLLLRRAEPPGRPAGPAQGALDGGTHPALRGRGARARAPRGASRLPAAARVVPELPARSRRARVAVGDARDEGDAPSLAAPRPPYEAHPATPARRDGVPLGLRRARDLTRPQGSPLRLRRPRRRADRVVSARRVRERPLRGQLELARANLVPGELSDRGVA